MKRSVRPGIIYLLIAFILLLIFIYAPIFVLREIRTDGMRFLTNEDIERICNIPHGTPLFSIETDEISRRLLNDLRIEEAVVRRSLPCYIDISVKERLPIATIAAENC
ncbi:MAG: FtsQ-type POTRA domain-containing protein, partial [Selenomonadaceae bacterium]|nr:FtsQ-type POTRA domain-containing protein [Selenomonadaceae bacterium]